MKKIKMLKSLVVIAAALVLCAACADKNHRPNGLKDSLTFVETVNIPHEEASVYSEERITTDQWLDCYKDEEENEYYFLPNTDTLCGYNKKTYYGFSEENPVGLEAAVAIADEYLSEKVENFKDYAVVLSEHVERDAVYHIQYSYLINGVATQDLINVFIQENGEIGAYFIPYWNMFKDTDVDTEKIRELPDEGEVKNEYITRNREGVVLVRYLGSQEDSSQMFVQKTYLLNPREGS